MCIGLEYIHTLVARITICICHPYNGLFCFCILEHHLTICVRHTNPIPSTPLFCTHISRCCNMECILMNMIDVI